MWIISIQADHKKNAPLLGTWQQRKNSFPIPGSERET